MDEYVSIDTREAFCQVTPFATEPDSELISLDMFHNQLHSFIHFIAFLNLRKIYPRLLP